jgi:hypothetical protein
MPTERFNAVWRGLEHSHHFGLSVVVLLVCHLQVNDISRNNERYEYHHVIHPDQALALGGDVGYLYALKQGQRLAFS